MRKIPTENSLFEWCILETHAFFGKHCVKHTKKKEKRKKGKCIEIRGLIILFYFIALYEMYRTPTDLRFSN